MTNKHTTLKLQTSSKTIFEQTYYWLLSIDGQPATQILKNTLTCRKEQFLNHLELNDLHFLLNKPFKSSYEWELFYKIQEVLQLFDLRIQEISRCDFEFANIQDRQEERLREKAKNLETKGVENDK